MSDFFIGVSLYAKEGREDELRAGLIAVVEPSRKDEGKPAVRVVCGSERSATLHLPGALGESGFAKQASHANRAHSPLRKGWGASAVEKYEYVYTLNRIA